MNPLDFIPIQYRLLAKAIGAVILVLALWFLWHEFTVHYIDIGRNEVRAELQPQIDEWKGAYDVLTAKLAAQNKAVNDLKDVSDQKQRAALVALQKAQGDIAYRERIINAATARETSRTGDRSCSAAVKDARADLGGAGK
jgi:hypothetical protein